MELISKLFGLGIVVVASDMILAQAGRKDVAFFITLIGVAIGLGIAVKEISDLFNSVTQMFRF